MEKAEPAPLLLEMFAQRSVRCEKPIYVMSPSVRAYVQIGRQWIEVPLAPIDESAASVLKITGKQAYRYVLEAKLADYAKLFSKYMHVRFVNTMLVSPTACPATSCSSARTATTST